MDGGRRLLRPVKEVLLDFQPSLPVHIGASDLAWSGGHAARPGRPPARRRKSRLARLFALLSGPGAGVIVALGFMAGVGFYGATLGGQYTSFTAAQGTLPDFAARMLGFGIRTVTVSGAHELSEKQILDIAGIRRTNSLLSLDVAKLRDRLVALPLVKDASVSKLYPNRVMIEIEERQPFALWQKDGVVKVVAADGTPLATFDASRHLDLPLVVGDGANARIADYVALLEAAGELRPRIAAGILVAGRRWTLKMRNGIEVKLPEAGAARAVAELAGLQRRYGVLDKNVIALDLRFPGRLIARLPDEATGAEAYQSNTKGSQT